MRPSDYDRTKERNLVSQIKVWGSNFTLIEKGTASDEDKLLTSIGQALRDVAVPVKWYVPGNASRGRILELREQLLQQLVDSPRSEHEIPMRLLSSEMKELDIAKQLAALNLVTFSTDQNVTSKDDVVIAPYYPAVIKQFTAYTTGSAQKSCGKDVGR